MVPINLHLHLDVEVIDWGLVGVCRTHRMESVFYSFSSIFLLLRKMLRHISKKQSTAIPQFAQELHLFFHLI